MKINSKDFRVRPEENVKLSSWPTSRRKLALAFDPRNDVTDGL